MPHIDRTDAQLVTALRAGSDAAFDAIVHRHEAALTAYARQVLGGAHHDAQECVQDAFVRALRTLRADDRPMALKAWLYTIVRNRCLDQLRKTQRTVDLADLEAVLFDRGADPHERVERREAVRAMVSGLQALPARQRRALVMLELEGASHEAIGRELGVSGGGSKALVCRGRSALVAVAA
jgi:RNA polymerase sigma-70 factor (ECF subfamily)